MPLFHSLIGIVAGILALVANPVYVLSILKGDTKPSRITWWILALLSAILVCSYYASGARDTIWIPVVYTISFTIVAILSILYGEGGWGILDVICLTGAGISLFLWWLLHSAEAALYLVVVTDFLGLIPTMHKAYKRPWTESKLSWSIAALAAVLNVVAIENWAPAISVYPVYVAVTNSIVAACVVFPMFSESPTLS